MSHNSSKNQLQQQQQQQQQHSVYSNCNSSNNSSSSNNLHFTVTAAATVVLKKPQPYISNRLSSPGLRLVLRYCEVVCEVKVSDVGGSRVPVLVGGPVKLGRVLKEGTKILIKETNMKQKFKDTFLRTLNICTLFLRANVPSF